VTLSYSEDGTNFKQIGTFSGLDVTADQPNPVTLSFTPVRASKMRFEYSQPNSSSWLQISEIEAYGRVVTSGAAQSFRASSAYPAYGSVELSGRLRDASFNPLSGKKMTVQYSYDNKAWKPLGTATTSPSGFFSYSAAPVRTTYYRTSFAGDAFYLASTPTVTSVRPRVFLSAPAASSKMHYRRTYSVSGYIKPRHAAGTRPVRLLAYRYQSGKWVYRRSFYATAYNYSSYTKYKASVKLPYKGRWRIRAYHPSDPLNWATYSGYRYSTVR
jgi:hypothetical protein